MELVEGSSLAQLIAERGRLPEREALEIARTVARALELASKHGVLHRDVKPGNVLLGRDGTPKLTDLGMARDHQASQVLTATGASCGSTVATSTTGACARIALPPAPPPQPVRSIHSADGWTTSATSVVGVG